MIEQMNHIGQLWWSWMGPMFWQVSVLIVLIGAIDLLLRRWAWPQVRYALWLLVLVKLVLPPGLSLPTSITSPLIAPDVKSGDSSVGWAYGPRDLIAPAVKGLSI